MLWILDAASVGVGYAITNKRGPTDMRRFKASWAAIVAVSALTALGAVTAATASAELPEFLPASGTFTSTSGAGTLEEGGEPAIECKEDTDSGEITGAKSATITIDFKSCTVFGIANAHSLGDSGSTILTGGKVILCYLNKTKKEVGALIQLAELHIEVAGKLLEVSGSVIGKVEPVNLSLKSGKIILKQTGGEQEFTKCEGGATEILKTSENEGTPKESGEETTDEETYAKATEVMA
jgi:hypothetical protein